MSRLEELRQRIESCDARIGVIGLGYVGLPLAVEFAKAGFEVIGVDVDAGKIRSLEEGRSYIEDVPERDIAEVREAGRFEATTDFRAPPRLDVINICVPPPLTRPNDPAVPHLPAAAGGIPRRLGPGPLAVRAVPPWPAWWRSQRFTAASKGPRRASRLLGSMTRSCW